MEENKKEEAPKSGAMTTEEANKNRLLIKEEICKYEQNIASLEGQIASLKFYIAEARTALADIDRREAGVAYPEPPKRPETSTDKGLPEAK